MPGMVELIEMNRPREDLFAMMYEASLTWERQRPGATPL